MSTTIKQYFSKAMFLEELSQFTSKIDTEASKKLPTLCIQSKEGVQHNAAKIGTMIHLINAIEGKELIDAGKSKTFRKRYLSIGWKDVDVKVDTAVQIETPIEVSPLVEEVIIEKEVVVEEISEETIEKEEATKPTAKKKTTPKKVAKPKKTKAR